MNKILSAFVFAIAVLSIGMQGSLEDILAPLPKVAEAAVVEPDNNDQADASRQTLKPLKNATSLASNPLSFRSPQAVPKRTVSSNLAIEPENAAFPIAADDLLRAIEEEVDARLKPVVDITLVPVKALPDLSAYNHPFSVRVGEIPTVLRRTIRISVHVENEQGSLGSWDLYFQPHLYTDVWFPRSTLRAGDLASISDFEPRRVDLLVESDAVIAKSESLLRREYSRDIRPGNPLKWSDLAQRSLVKRGQVVDVIANQGRIAISMRAKAEQDGVEGDMVFLQNLDSNKKFAAEVIGEGLVQVTF